ncbi:DUF6537 domain-containing protein [Streptomyces sp. NPDC102360]|uniref:DUF6537 domain-containing protein n=1 Tax=Streptomyces sp. NPDC102360 TaxID=3366160 RepID=UPI0038284011
MVEEILQALTPATHELAVTIACLPDHIRGYEQIKLDNVTFYRDRLNEIRRELGNARLIQLHGDSREF